MQTNHEGPFDGVRMNKQPIEKATRSSGVHLDTIGVFYTVQGEGPFSGMPAIFIRLAGCNLQCPFCDTDYTAGREARAVDGLVDQVVQLARPGVVKLVVITGGEPFRQQIGNLIAKLIDAGFAVQVESNGTLPPNDLTVWGLEWKVQPSMPLHGAYIVCSPKTGKVHEKVVSRACCFKYVLDADHIDEDDGLPTTALGHTANPRVARPPSWWDRPVYVQPADHADSMENRRNVKVAVASAMNHGYTLQLQLHKHVGLE